MNYVLRTCLGNIVYILHTMHHSLTCDHCVVQSDSYITNMHTTLARDHSLWFKATSAFFTHTTWHVTLYEVCASCICRIALHL